MNAAFRRLGARLLLLWLALILAIAQVAPAAAQDATPTAGSDGVQWRICDRPNVCFADAAARQAWAAENDCRFLEDVCEKAPASEDNRGAKEEDRGFWGELWDGVKGALVYGYEFVKGLVAGLKDQIEGLIGLVTNAGELIGGLIELGKAFYDDPRGTLAQLAELIGQEAVDTITRATQCGAYDLGKVIGENVSPVLVAKLAIKLKKFGGNLARAVRDTKVEFGCASFAAGTSVLTPEGSVPIESIRTGQLVLSRDDRTFADLHRPVTQTFSRLAPHHRLLVTEFDSYRVTDEHPFWVQGKGWTEAKDVTAEDTIASSAGDVRVVANEAVAEELRVFNFSVGETPSYFVGASGAWAHNAGPCSVWSADPKVRGRLVEDYLTHTDYKDWQRTDHLIDPKTGEPFKNPNFPLIDFQKGNVVVSLKTVDTRGASWDADMKSHIRELANREITVDGQLATKVLDIRVQPGGSADAAHLIQYGQQHGITVIIKEVDL